MIGEPKDPLEPLRDPLRDSAMVLWTCRGCFRTTLWFRGGAVWCQWCDRAMEHD